MISESTCIEIKSDRIYSSVSTKPQDYYSLKDKCLRNNTLFEDDVFPADNASIYGQTNSKTAIVEWLRPSDLVAIPIFMDESPQRFDVNQGELGNCWLLAAITNLTLNKQLFNKVVILDDNNDGSGFKSGIFHFTFWQFGKWIDVVIDDRLPIVNKKLMNMRSKSGNIFWGALLEKAYAKLYGSYKVLEGGTAGEAMEDFTGGLTEYFDLKSNSKVPTNLLQIMIKANDRNSMMACSIEPKTPSDIRPSQQQQLQNGLITGHAYSVTDVILLDLKSDKLKKGKLPLVRVRNPWGNDAEWKGAWSDGSREWTLVSDEEKKQLGLTFEDDGEFWISFKDFELNFSALEICNLTPDGTNDEDVDDDGKKWEVYSFDGAWIRGISAGGCRNYLDTFFMNPQYMLTLIECDDDSDGLCTCIVSLMQKNQRSKRQTNTTVSSINLSIGFAIYKIREEDQVDSGKAQELQNKLLTTNFFRYNESIARSLAFINSREVNGRFHLKPGKYCIIPSTFNAHEEGEYLLRIFTENCAHDVTENDNKFGVVKTPDSDVISKEKFRSDLSLATNNENGFFNIFNYCWINFGSKTGATEAETEAYMKPDVIKQVDASIVKQFEKVGGNDEEVDAKTLRSLLNRALKKQFNFGVNANNKLTLDTCKSLISMLDFNKTGRLSIDQFRTVWANVRHWCYVFKKHETDRNNNSNDLITARQLRTAFLEIGFTVNRSVLRCLILRYGQRELVKSGEKKFHIMCLTFDEFVKSCFKLKKCVDIWNAKQTDPQFSLDEFVESIIYCSV